MNRQKPTNKICDPNIDETIKNGTKTQMKQSEMDTNCKIDHETSKEPTLIKLRITEKRKGLWKTWSTYSNYEIGSKMLEEAIETAIQMKQLQKRVSESEIYALLKPLLNGETIEIKNKNKGV